MATASRVAHPQRTGCAQAASASTQALTAIQRSTANLSFSQLFAALGLPVGVPAFEPEWDYTGLLPHSLARASINAAAVVGGHSRIRVADPGGFLEHFTVALRAIR